MHCEREGKPKDGVKTKKCGCPFALICRERKRETWLVEVLHGFHNHAISSNLYGHSIAGRLKGQSLQVVKSMTASNCSPNQIATTLNDLPEEYTSKKQIYTCRYNMRKAAREGRSVCQEFFHRARELNYYVQHREDQATGRMTNAFFTSPQFNCPSEGNSLRSDYGFNLRDK